MTELELISKINNISFSSQRIPDYNAYIVKTNGMIGVAIPVNKELMINEQFNKVFIKNLTLSINGVSQKVIMLFTKGTEISEKYASLCMNFISTNSRNTILNNPIDWYNEWRDLLGNSKKNKLIYDFIGEMAVLLELQKKDKCPLWNSINKGTFDITTDDSIYEVKTSIVKSFDSITIHNQFQLDTEGLHKNLYISYVKVEENNDGESIDTLAKQLVESGFDETILENYLTTSGYYNGKSERYRKYIIHEIRLYKVDENFPFITKKSFVDQKMPRNVVKLEYTISLDGLEYSKF